MDDFIVALIAFLTFMLSLLGFITYDLQDARNDVVRMSEMCLESGGTPIWEDNELKECKRGE